MEKDRVSVPTPLPLIKTDWGAEIHAAVCKHCDELLIQKGDGLTHLIHYGDGDTKEFGPNCPIG
jgi:hypothetical protein